MNMQRANAIMMALIGVLLLGLCIPGILYLRRSATRTEMMDRLRKQAIALQTYHDDRVGFPPIFDHAKVAVRADASIFDRIDTGGPHQAMPYAVSFYVHLLPYVDASAVYSSYLRDGKGNADAVVPVFLNPSDGSVGSGAGSQCFAANLRTFSAKGAATPARENLPPLAPIEPGRTSIRNFIRGTSNTVILAPKLAQCGEGGSRYAADPTSPFASFFGQNVARTTAHYSNPAAIYQWAPRGAECLTTPLMAQTFRPEHLVVAMCDCSTRTIQGNIDPGLWNRIVSLSMEN